jgi:tetratricopeptide (TPR) repeat protein
MAREKVESTAEELFAQGMDKSAAGDEQGALALYLESLALKRDQPVALYNVGLIYKYRREWKESLRYNRLAAELAPDDEATNWNVGIAATALREWRVARQAWIRAGIRMDESDEPIDGKFGYTPVRLNGFEDTDAQREVVWAHRVSPVTARISNIPTPEARFRYGDVVLHDGAPVGTRIYAPCDERSVFNVFELFEPSDFVTYEVELDAPDEAAIETLASACEQHEIEFEDWTSDVTLICKACSEGRAHEQHDHSGALNEWRIRRRVGLASKDSALVQAALEEWSAQGEGRYVDSVQS